MDRVARPSRFSADVLRWKDRGVEAQSLGALAGLIHRSGPIAFSTFQAAALVGPDGFYINGGGAGRRRDFLTSPEVGPLFGAVVASCIDAEWVRLGRPDPFVVIECGAGPGTLARSVVAAVPSCLSSLRYVLVDPSPSMAAAQRQYLSIDPPTGLFGVVPPAGPDGDGDRVPAPSQGPVMVSLAEMPTGPFPGIVLANELLDNLPVDLAERGRHCWNEVRVSHDGTGFSEVLVAAAPAMALRCESLAPSAAVGARVPLQQAAQMWLREAFEVLDGGRVVVIDYARPTTAVFADLPSGDWLRTYTRHVRGEDPFAAPGLYDITCDVAVDQLSSVRGPSVISDQASFLRAHGIDGLVAEAARYWDAHVAVGDLAALRARSRVSEASALVDPLGLGGFTVLEWVV